MTEPTPARLFVSYASADRQLIAPLVDHLRGQGWDVWWDRQIAAGEAFDRRIERELVSADAVIVVWSRASVASNWVLSEAMIGFETGRLVPVALDARLALPLPFNRVHTVSLADWTGATTHPGLDDLTRGIHATLESRGLRNAQAREPVAPSKPVVAVLPFDDLDGAGGARPLCSLVPARLIAALGRFTGLDTLARRASFDASLQAREIRAVARALRADYVVTGSVCGDGESLMLSVELIEGDTGRQTWSLAVTPDEAGELSPDRAADEIARALGGEFLRLGRARARDGATRGDALSAVEASRDGLLQASRAAIADSQAEARRALVVAPGSAHAHALLASALAEEIVNGYATDLQAATREALREAEQALLLGPDDHAVLKYAGHALAICGEHEQAERVLRRALELNRYDDGALGYLGWVLGPSTAPGHLDEARSIFDTLLARTHKHPGRPFWFLHRSVALTCAGDFEGALAAARIAMNFGPNLSLAWLHAVNALGQLGRLDDARALIDRCPLDLARSDARWAAILRQVSRDAEAAELRSAGLRRVGLIADRASDDGLRDAFAALWVRAGGDPTSAGAAWQAIASAYSEPGRRYHTLDHLRHCLHQADLALQGRRDADAILLAIFFHDVVYETGATDNEARSAERFRALATRALPPPCVDDVARLVLATRYGEIPRGDDEAWMIDIDYSSFGRPWEEFLRDSEAVRAERPDLADGQFAVQQVSFLESLLARDSLFWTEHFRRHCEAQARENIRRYVVRLRAP